jgi:hypothetical protein
MASLSGDVSANNNDNIGDVSTGNTVNDANIVNVANTLIGNGGYFVGVINVYGDLQGNIEIPNSLIDQLKQESSPNNNLNNFIFDSTNNITITNNTAMDASTGQITLANNDKIGNAKSGDAINNLETLNYSGFNLINENSMLIIVNVLGKWQGLLLGSPSNSTLITAKSSPDGSTSSADRTFIQKYHYNTNTVITNNISLLAKSGDTTISYNDDVGDVKTGNAINNAKIINIANVSLSLADWFGVLFINILGNWYGSVVAQATPMQEETSSAIPAPFLSNITTQPNPLNTNPIEFPLNDFNFRQNYKAVGTISEPTENTGPIVVTKINNIAKNTPKPNNDVTSQSWQWLILLAIISLTVFSTIPVSRFRPI